MFKVEFIKSIISVHTHYQEAKHPNSEFLTMINKCFNIKKTTFYEWLKDEDILKYNVINENQNKLINNAVETYIIDLYNKNKKVGIKNIKKQVNTNFKISINNKSIYYVLHKHNINHKNIKKYDFFTDYQSDKKKLKKDNKLIKLNEEQKKFIIDNTEEDAKKTCSLFYTQFKINIHQKQVVHVKTENKLKIKSYFKSSPAIVNFILDTIIKKRTSTVKEIRELVLTEFKTNISIQFIYNILKKNGYTYKKFKINNNPYSLLQQVAQFEEVTIKHNIKNIDNCVSIDEISFVLGSKPDNGWFKKGDLIEVKSNSKSIIRIRYSLLVASNNKKILLYKMCKGGVKTDFFIQFMDELSKLDVEKKWYYLLDNARIHKSIKFKKFAEENKLDMVYNAPYHSETNPIENIFSMLRNELNRSNNETELELLKSINKFIAKDNQEKFKNIFNHSIKMINQFIADNKKK